MAAVERRGPTVEIKGHPAAAAPVQEGGDVGTVGEEQVSEGETQTAE
jgi:hypothetical protein